MSDLAIRVENLGKKYHIGGKQERYSTLRDSLVQGISAPFKRIGGLLRGEAAAASDLSEEIWALKDVSFDIKHGDVVGIIGRNGAGKSTLLKILSQITEPTTGRAEIYGRVGALLEVGTGFHPELTGRENIFLNGAILGMRRKEMERKFDEIVDFSGVEKFIDTPVKHYSSGMQMRLAFAVAAHLEPEILIVDEVLAVGDAEFQKKCMGKMGEVAKGGRTVLFVSHNLAAVRQLCSSGILLSSGSVATKANIDTVITTYAKYTKNQSNERQKNYSFVFVESVRVINPISKDSVDTFFYGDSIGIEIKVNFVANISDLDIGVVITGLQSGIVAHLYNKDDELVISGVQGQSLAIAIYIENTNLSPAEYFVSVWIGKGMNQFDRLDDVIQFEVLKNHKIKRNSHYPKNFPVFYETTWQVY